MILKQVGFIFLFSALACILFSARTAGAATFSVDTFADSNAPAQQACTGAPNDCSLRGAVLAANALAGTDTINVPAGVYVLTIAGGEDLSVSGDLDIRDSVNINALGAGARIDGSALVSDKVLEIPVGVVATAMLSKLAFNGGQNGGISISAGSTASLSLCVVENNTNTGGSGGGIVNSGNLTLTLSLVRNNSAASEGGGISNSLGSQLTVDRSNIKLNQSSGSNGGGISNYGTATLTSSTIESNTALLVGGGISNRGTLTANSSNILSNVANGAGPPLGGGGLFNEGNGSVLTLNNSRVEGNSAPMGYGGGIVNNDTAILRVNQSQILGNSAQYAGGLDAIGRTTVTDSAINDNAAVVLGGGVLGGGNYPIISFVRTRIENNTAGSNGGGLYLSGGWFLLSQVDLIGNVAQGYGGGLYQLANSSGGLLITNSTIVENRAPSAIGDGGGIFNYTSNLKLDHVTVAGNFATVNGGGISHTDGALTVVSSAIYANHTEGNGGGVSQDYDGANTTSSFTNVTLSSNVASGDGGAIYNSQDLGVSDIYFFNVTVASNEAFNSLSDGLFLDGGVLNADHSIIGDQATSGADCLLAGGATVAAPGVNLEEGTSCGFSFNSVSPLLGGLAANGGSTPTHALLTGSPAIDAGAAGGCPGDLNGDGVPDVILTKDQRDLPRGALCDLGAYEF